MKKLKEYYESHSYIDFILIVLYILLFFIFFAKHFLFIIPDIGREYFLSSQVLKGAVPYKDITLIYFPLAYYINACIFKILGVQIDSLLITQTIISTLYMIAYYCFSKEFLDRKTSLLLTFLVISCCLFARSEVFSFITPYSYGRMYGTIGGFACIYSIVKLFKTNNIKFAYFAAFIVGFSICCKIEFFSVLLIFIIGLFLYKRLTIYNYIKLFLTFLIMPLFTLSLLFIQGVTINDLTNAIDFAIKFSKTPTMTEYLNFTGVYPLGNIYEIIKNTTNYCSYLVTIIFLCFLGLKIKTKYYKLPILTLFAVFIWYFYYNFYAIYNYFYWVPFVILAVLIFKFKEYYKTDRLFLFLILATLLLSRSVFYLNLMQQTFSFPLSILCICILIDRFFCKKIAKIELKSLINFVLIILIGFYSFSLIRKRAEANYLVTTPHGNFYTNHKTKVTFDIILQFINNETDINSSVLVLPEGNIINFLTDRKCDLHWFMMDKFYHDAYGAIKSRDKVANTNSDYIILLYCSELNSFNNLSIYTPGNPTFEWINSAYSEIKFIQIDGSNIIRIYKKK